MYKTSFRLSLFVIIFMLPWAAIYAAGLGKLTLNSALGQPLNAEIDIVSAARDEVQSLRASVASRDAYANAGFSYESILSSIKASVESRSNGTPYIKLTSAQAVNDPFLMVLMELSWSAGKILREYTVLLDPVEMGSQDVISANTGLQTSPITSPLKEETASVPVNASKQTKKNGTKAASDTSRDSKNTYGPVNRGDTLSSIARQVMPPGVNLNQMLVALHRANRDAFISNNMNLLKVGAVLAIPEKNEIAAIDTSTANTVVKAQVEDWRNYQNNLSRISREVPAARSISQSDQGKITTDIEKKNPIPSDAPKEVLKLSSGAQFPETTNESTDTGLIDRLRMMEEDAVARNLALKEANERVAMLEKSVQNLKHLLELKDSVLAQAQLNAESQPKLNGEATIKPPISDTPMVEHDPNTGNDLAQEWQQQEEIPSIPAIVEPAKAPAAIAPSVPLSDGESSWVDWLFEHIEYIGLVSLLLLLMTLLVIKRRKAKAENEDGGDEETKESFSSAMRSRLTGITAARAASTAAADQSMPEYEMSDDEMKSSDSDDQYGNFDNDVETYETNDEYSEVAAKPSDTPSDQGNVDRDDFAFDRDMADAFDDQVSRASESSDESASALSAAMTDFDTATETESMGNEQFDDVALNQNDEEVIAADDMKDSDNSDDHELGLDFTLHEQSEDSQTDTSPAPVSEENNDGLDFDFDNSAINLTEDTDNDSKLPDLDEKISLADDVDNESIANDALDFEMPNEDAFESEKTESSEKLPELGLAEIDLDLGEQSQPAQNASQSEEVDADEQWQEVETKLDLAKAYLEMDDKEGAKEMLEEVLKDGNDKQKKVAKKMLKGL